MNIYTGLFLLLLCGCQSMPQEIGVTCSTVRETDKEIISYSSNGTMVLQISKRLSPDPDKSIIHPGIFFKGRRVVDILDIQGRRSFQIKPNTPLSVGATVDDNGNTTDVLLTGKNHVLQEWFMVKDKLLYPVPNEELARAQCLMTDVGSLFDPDNIKRLTPDEFTDQAVGVAIKHKKK